MANFINPYNFVPLAKYSPKRGPAQEEAAGKLYTGKIRYRMKTLSPLFIPNTSNDRILGIRGEDDNEDTYHKSYDFFSYHDLSKDTDPNVYYEPVVPGSEIRGMVRSVYEAMTNSCLSAVDEDETLSKRTVEQFNAGILLKSENGYELYAATDYLYRVNGRKDFSVHSYEDKGLPPDGSHVYFDKDTESAPRRPRKAKPFACNISCQRDKGQSEEGYLIKGEPGPELKKSENGSKCKDCPQDTQQKCRINGQKNCYFLEKHCAHVFQKDTRVRVMGQSEADDVRQRMDKLLEIYASNRDRKMYEEYRRTWKEFNKPGSQMEGIAVYYSIVDDICYLSPACITREVYRNTLRKILGAHGACSKADQVCPACRLFGAVNSNLQKASKIRFSDAYVAEKKEDNAQYYDEPITLLELSAPKLSTTEFYLQRPKDQRVMNWTYDYYVVLGPDNTPVLRTYGENLPQISGRKFYWHSPKTAEWLRGLQGKKIMRDNELQDLIPKNERNKTVRPLKEKVAFQGELYFDGISKSQLDELIRILNISELDEEEKYALKLGSAKPLGFGSVAMQVEEVVFRTVSLDENSKLVYKPDNLYDFLAVELTQEIRESGILTILDMKALENLKDSRVHYPKIEDDAERKGEEGFKWFTENRAGMRKPDRKEPYLNPNDKDPAPKSRQQIVYLEYMKPLSPKIEINETGKNLVNKTDRQGKDGEQSFTGSQGTGGQGKGNQGKGNQGKGNQGKAIPEHGAKKIYKAKILTSGQDQKGDGKYLRYKINILDSGEFQGKNCTLSAHSKLHLSVSDTVEVVQYKGTLFNLK